MNKILYWLAMIIGYVFSLLVLVFIGQFIFRYIYYVGIGDGGNWIGSNLSWSLIFGEIFAYFFFSIFLVVIFFNKNGVKMVFLLVILLINLIISLVIFGFQDLLFILLFILLSLSGYLLAELIKFLYNKFKK